MIKPKLTIGMATIDDYHGVYFTLQMLREYHIPVQCELLVIDTNPTSQHGKILKRQINDWFQDRTAGVKYIPAPECKGTSAPRNRVFAEASSDWVMCVDCHVGFRNTAIGRLMHWIQANPNSQDLITGPRLYDNLTTMTTHFNDEWRDQMWGTWGGAWQTPPCVEKLSENSETSTVDRFSVIEDTETKKCKFITLEMNPQPLPTRCRELPDLNYAGHETVLLQLGYKGLGIDLNDVFEIPGMGLGVFCCRRDAWLGFNKYFKGFGGEEMYIHNKFRKAGRRCLSLGFLKWFHRDERPDGLPYVNNPLDRVHNYIMGKVELDDPLDPVREHYPNISKTQWNTYVKEAEKCAVEGGKIELPPQPAPLENTGYQRGIGSQTRTVPKSDDIKYCLPGSELVIIFHELGFEQCLGCQHIAGMLDQMSHMLSLDAVRQHREEFVDKIYENSQGFDWSAKIHAAKPLLEQRPMFALRAGWKGITALVTGSSLTEAGIKSVISDAFDEACDIAYTKPLIPKKE